jgi:hypothetical protein
MMPMKVVATGALAIATMAGINNNRSTFRREGSTPSIPMQGVAVPHSIGTSCCKRVVS